MPQKQVREYLKVGNCPALLSVGGRRPARANSCLITLPEPTQRPPQIRNHQQWSSTQHLRSRTHKRASTTNVKSSVEIELVNRRSTGPKGQVLLSGTPAIRHLCRFQPHYAHGRSRKM